jgi:hypothetical protein
MALPPVQREDITTVLMAGSVLALVDALVALAINTFILDQPTFSRTFQGIASALLGKQAFEMGAGAVFLGIALHFTVAFFWITLYLLFYRNSSLVRRAASGKIGLIFSGAVLGALIWLLMNFVVFPSTKIVPLMMNEMKFHVRLLQHVIIVGPLVVLTARHREKPRPQPVPTTD